MIKKSILLAALVVLFKVASCQVLIALIFGDKLNNDKLEFGMNVGFNYSLISNLDFTNSRPGFNLGMNFVYKINDKFYLNPALFFTFPMGARDLDIYETPDSNLNEVLKDTELNRKLSYFSLPITIRYRLFKLTFLDFGPQISLQSNAEDVFKGNLFNNDEVVYTSNIKNDYKLFDFGFTAGVSQRLKPKGGITLNLRYYYGMIDILKDNDGPAQHNSAIYFSATIPVGGTKYKEPKVAKEPKEK